MLKRECFDGFQILSIGPKDIKYRTRIIYFEKYNINNYEQNYKNMYKIKNKKIIKLTIYYLCIRKVIYSFWNMYYKGKG